MATWGQAQVDEFLTEAVPLVMQFAADAPSHLESVGADGEDRRRLKALLLEAG